MPTAVYIIAAILIFGLLIFIHEGGHFLFARLFKVTVNEFSIGMGPKLISKKSKKSGIAYSLRAFPIGGFVSMAGEDEESDDPNALGKKPVWQRIIIVAAGAVTNLVAGVLVMFILVFASTNVGIGSTTVAEFRDGATSSATGLMTGDKIVEVQGRNVHIADELIYEIMRLGVEPVDLTVERDGKEIVLEDVQFPTTSSQGIAFGDADFYVYGQERTFGNLMRHSFYKSTYTVRMIWESLYDLVSGRYGIEAVSGPVGVTEALTEAAQTGAYSFIYLVVVISMNLGVVNLLPLPALDGGRLVFLIIEGIRRKPVSPKVENVIHTAGLAILMLLMIFICVKDVIKLF